jgi:hypothetical protein
MSTRLVVPTTFVLGAGASHPYGLPLASELRNQIASDPSGDIVHRCSQGDSKALQAELRSDHSFLHRLRSSGLYSVDRFLELNPKYISIGTLAIAARIAEAECVAAIQDKVITDWYQWLFNRLLVTNALDSSNFRVVTFNYDRSLEIALCRMLMSACDIPFSDAKIAIDSLPIVHVYGQLQHAWRYESDLSVSFDISGQAIRDSSNAIRVVAGTRDSENSPELSLAREYISDARRIVFLGFGFDELNLQRIGCHSSSEQWNSRRLQKEIYATGIGLGPARREEIIRMFRRPVNWNQLSTSCLEFLSGEFGFSRPG